MTYQTNLRTAARRRHRIKARQARAAFSLIEIMVVIVIIGMLTAIVSVSLRGQIARSKIKTTAMEIGLLVDAIESFNGFNGKYPSKNQGLEVLLTGTEDDPNAYLDGADLNDPWGNPYEYALPGDNNQPYEIISAGADSQFGTADDVSNVTLLESE